MNSNAHSKRKKVVSIFTKSILLLVIEICFYQTMSQNFQLKTPVKNKLEVTQLKRIFKNAQHFTFSVGFHTKTEFRSESFLNFALLFKILLIFIFGVQETFDKNERVTFVITIQEGIYSL